MKTKHESEVVFFFLVKSNDKLIHIRFISDFYVRRDLIDRLLCFEPSKRLCAKAVLKHPLFWSRERQMAFFQVLISIFMCDQSQFSLYDMSV